MDLTLEVDEFGRVLLPEALREALHLRPGDKLRAHLDGERLTVTPEHRAAVIRIENGFPVIDLPEGVRITGDPVAEARASRDREILDSLSGEW
ncbi:MAG: AbrB/MazE/SpoVT family DNA-binding domain-containing protein [Deinococcus sp.]